MNKLIFAILIFFTAPLFAQGRVIDTIFVDSHKVTYIIDTSHTNPRLANGDVVPDSIAPEDSSGLHAAPYSKNRLSAELIVQGFDPAITLERILWAPISIALRLSYVNFEESDIHTNTNAEGTISAITTPLMLRWYWGRRNTGKYYVIDASAQKYERKKNQVECFFQASINPVFYSVDIEYDNEDTRFMLRDKEFGMPLTFGLGTKMITGHFFLGTEINIGKFIKKTKFQNRIKVYESRYDTRLLQNMVYESILVIGFAF